MMSESNMAINVFSTPTSSSRLSPLAPPFTLSNPFNRHESFDPLLDSSSLSTSILDQPFPYLSLGSQVLHGSSGYLSDTTSVTAFPCADDLDFETNYRFAYYPIQEPPVHSHFTLPTHQSSQSFISSSSSLGHVGYKSGVKGTHVDQQGREVPHGNDQIRNANGSLFCNNLLEQGTTATKGSKLVSETSSVLSRKGSVVIGKDNRIRPEDKKRILTERNSFQLANSEVNLLKKCKKKPFSISSDLSLSPRPQDSHSQASYSAPLMTWSHCDSTVITTERCFPHHGSCRAETLVSCAAESFSYSAQIFKPSSASPNPTIINSVPSENMGSGGTDAVSNVDSYVGYVVPSLMDTDVVQNLVEKVACHDQVIIEKGEKRNIVEPVETENPSIMAKPKLQIACLNVLKDLTLEQHGAKAGIPDDKSSNPDDSDVDSPCWKGTQAYNSPLRDSMPVNSDDSKGQSPPRVSVLLKSEHSKNEKVARNSLNPLAPVFIPGKSKRKVDYYQLECPGDSSVSSQKIATVAVTSSSILGAVKADMCPSEKINDIGIHCSNDACDSRKEYGVPYKTFKSSGVNSFSFQPYLREDYVPSKSQLVRGTNVTGSMEGIADATQNVLDSLEDTAHNGSNTSISFLSEFALNSHSVGLGVFKDSTERLRVPLKSTAPKIDVKLMINTIQYLSQLLLQTSFYVGSLTDREHDKLLNTINNLYVVIRNKPELHHLCSLYGQRQVADHHEVTKVRDKAVLHDGEMHETSAPMLSSRMPHSFYQSNSDEGFKKGNDIGQVIEKDPKVINSIEYEMPPEALFYRKLWVEAEAALSLMKYRVCALDTKAEPDRC